MCNRKRDFAGNRLHGRERERRREEAGRKPLGSCAKGPPPKPWRQPRPGRGLHDRREGSSPDRPWRSSSGQPGERGATGAHADNHPRPSPRGRPGAGDGVARRRDASCQRTHGPRQVAAVPSIDDGLSGGGLGFERREQIVGGQMQAYCRSLPDGGLSSLRIGDFNLVQGFEAVIDVEIKVVLVLLVERQRQSERLSGRRGLKFMGGVFGVGAECRGLGFHGWSPSWRLRPPQRGLGAHPAAARGQDSGRARRRRGITRLHEAPAQEGGDTFDRGHSPCPEAAGCGRRVGHPGPVAGDGARKGNSRKAVARPLHVAQTNNRRR